MQPRKSLKQPARNSLQSFRPSTRASPRNQLNPSPDLKFATTQNKGGYEVPQIAANPSEPQTTTPLKSIIPILSDTNNNNLVGNIMTKDLPKVNAMSLATAQEKLLESAPKGSPTQIKSSVVPNTPEKVDHNQPVTAENVVEKETITKENLEEEQKITVEAVKIALTDAIEPLVTKWIENGVQDAIAADPVNSVINLDDTHKIDSFVQIALLLNASSPQSLQVLLEQATPTYRNAALSALRKAKQNFSSVQIDLRPIHNDDYSNDGETSDSEQNSTDFNSGATKKSTTSLESAKHTQDHEELTWTGAKEETAARCLLSQDLRVEEVDEDRNLFMRCRWLSFKGRTEATEALSFQKVSSTWQEARFIHFELDSYNTQLSNTGVKTPPEKNKTPAETKLLCADIEYLADYTLAQLLITYPKLSTKNTQPKDGYARLQMSQLESLAAAIVEKMGIDGLMRVVRHPLAGTLVYRHKQNEPKDAKENQALKFPTFFTEGEVARIVGWFREWRRLQDFVSRNPAEETDLQNMGTIKRARAIILNSPGRVLPANFLVSLAAPSWASRLQCSTIGQAVKSSYNMAVAKWRVWTSFATFFRRLTCVVAKSVATAALFRQLIMPMSGFWKEAYQMLTSMEGWVWLKDNLYIGEITNFLGDLGSTLGEYLSLAGVWPEAKSLATHWGKRLSSVVSVWSSFARGVLPESVWSLFENLGTLVLWGDSHLRRGLDWAFVGPYRWVAKVGRSLISAYRLYTEIAHIAVLKMSFSNPFGVDVASAAAMIEASNPAAFCDIVAVWAISSDEKTQETLQPEIKNLSENWHALLTQNNPDFGDFDLFMRRLRAFRQNYPDLSIDTDASYLKLCRSSAEMVKGGASSALLPIAVLQIISDVIYIAMESWKIAALSTGVGLVLPFPTTIPSVFRTNCQQAWFKRTMVAGASDRIRLQQQSQKKALLLESKPEDSDAQRKYLNAVKNRVTRLDARATLVAIKQIDDPFVQRDMATHVKSLTSEVEGLEATRAKDEKLIQQANESAMREARATLRIRETDSARSAEKYSRLFQVSLALERAAPSKEGVVSDLKMEELRAEINNSLNRIATKPAAQTLEDETKRLLDELAETRRALKESELNTQMINDLSKQGTEDAQKLVEVAKEREKATNAAEKIVYEFKDLVMGTNTSPANQLRQALLSQKTVKERRESALSALNQSPFDVD